MNTATTFTEYYNRLLNEPIYVVLGAQGSGTNLLCNILRQIFDFSVVQDRCLIFSAAARLGTNPTPREVDREYAYVYSRLFPSELRRRIQLKHYHHQARGYVDANHHRYDVPIRSATEFARFWYCYQAFRFGNLRLAIKSDDIHEQIDALDLVIPNSKILFLTRDFRDGLLSVGNKDFGPIEPECVAWYVKERIACYHQAYRDRHANGMLIKYETMLQAPREFIEQFATRFGIAPCAGLEAAIANLGIRSQNYDKWRKMPADQLARCEGILQDELNCFNYPLASLHAAPPSRGRMLWLTLKDWGKRIPRRVLVTLKQLTGTVGPQLSSVRPNGQSASAG